MSAIEEEPVNDGPTEVIQVLFALHAGFGAQELCGPLEVLSNALQKITEPSSYQLVPTSVVLSPSHPPPVYFLSLQLSTASLSLANLFIFSQAPKHSNAPSPPPPPP